MYMCTDSIVLRCYSTHNDSFQVCSLSFDSALHIRENFVDVYIFQRKYVRSQTTEQNGVNGKRGKRARERESNKRQCARLCALPSTLH